MLELDAGPRPRRRTRSRPHLGGVMRQLEQHAQKVALPAERERIAEGLFEQSVQALLVVGLEL
jgi:hypothetical protein